MFKDQVNYHAMNVKNPRRPQIIQKVPYLFYKKHKKLFLWLNIGFKYQ